MTLDERLAQQALNAEETGARKCCECGGGDDAGGDDRGDVRVKKMMMSPESGVHTQDQIPVHGCFSARGTGTDGGTVRDTTRGVQVRTEAQCTCDAATRERASERARQRAGSMTRPGVRLLPSSRIALKGQDRAALATCIDAQTSQTAAPGAEIRGKNGQLKEPFFTPPPPSSFPFPSPPPPLLLRFTCSSSGCPCSLLRDLTAKSMGSGTSLLERAWLYGDSAQKKSKASWNLGRVVPALGILSLTFSINCRRKPK
eukprot:1384116-Rhodomonas_salina.1